MWPGSAAAVSLRIHSRSSATKVSLANSILRCLNPACRATFFRYQKSHSVRFLGTRLVYAQPETIRTDMRTHRYRLADHFLIPELQLIQTGVNSVAGQQLLVGSLFRDASVCNDRNFIGIFDGG